MMTDFALDWGYSHNLNPRHPSVVVSDLSDYILQAATYARRWTVLR
jgi:hypothetical protein